MHSGVPKSGSTASNVILPGGASAATPGGETERTGTTSQMSVGGNGTGKHAEPGAPGSTFDASFTCDEAALPPVEGLRRLTMTQYQNSVRDLMAWSLGDAALSAQVMTELASALDDVPADIREAVPEDLHGSYRRLDQSLQQNHVDAIYGLGV